MNNTTFVSTALIWLVLTTTSTVTEAANKKPTVKAGNRQNVKEQTLVTLNGTASDKDGSISKLVWTQIKGTPVLLTGADTLTPSFTAPTLTKTISLGFKLTATDNSGASASATTTVAVTPVNAKPIANAGVDKTVGLSVAVTLDGSGSNDAVDGNIVNWQWKQTAGQKVW